MKKQLLFVTLLFIYSFIQAQTMGTITDTRDGQTYRTVAYENILLGESVVWMAQNLNYSTTDSYAYGNNEKHRKNLGLLYTWEAAMKACPRGWHLATDTEWQTLINDHGGTDDAGKALKGSKGWIDDGNGSNSSGFNALPAGVRYSGGTFGSLGKIAYCWSASSSSESRAWEYDLYCSSSRVLRDQSNKENAYSCRCVRD